MAQHTNGPWTVGSSLLTNDGGRPIMGVDAQGDAQRVALVDCHTSYKRGQGWQTHCPEREANAALIAAAPAMLAALEVAFMDLGRAGGNTADSPYRASWEQARAAIALTRGEA